MTIDPERPWCDRAKSDCAGTVKTARFFAPDDRSSVSFQLSDEDAALYSIGADFHDRLAFFSKRVAYESAMLIDWQITRRTDPDAPRPATPLLDSLGDDLGDDR
jgi:hypothetical protein